jgi:phosphoribosyl 1,2-cyclic phosphodiesterase
MRIGEFNITAIPVSHDAEEPLGFAICDDFSRLMIATDLGCVNERILNEISQSQGVILESNHDVAMLLNGSYSEDLKRRILSQWGHLSNSQCSAALKEAVWKGLKMVVLAHLSKENNLPEIALTQTQKILPRGIKLSTANRSYTTGPFIL